MLRRYYSDDIIKKLADIKTRGVRVRCCKNCKAEKLTGIVAISKRWTGGSPLVCPQCNSEEVRIVRYQTPSEVKIESTGSWNAPQKRERYAKMAEYKYGVYRFGCRVCKSRWTAVEVNLFGRIEPPLEYCANCDTHGMGRLRVAAKDYEKRMKDAKYYNLKLDLSDLLERKRQDDPTTSPLIAQTERKLGLATGINSDPDLSP